MAPSPLVARSPKVKSLPLRLYQSRIAGMSSAPFVLNTSYQVRAPTHCGYGQRGRYVAHVEVAAAAWERRTANSTDLELWAGHVARVVVTGSGHTSTT